MSLRPLKLLVVMLVALLQCFVPLLHAHAHTQAYAHQHVDGVDHVHVNGVLLESDQADSHAMPEMKAPHDHPQAIGMSEEFKRDGFGALLLQAALVTCLLIAVFAVSRRAIKLAEPSTPVLKRSPHYRPPATAPPVSNV